MGFNLIYSKAAINDLENIKDSSDQKFIISKIESILTQHPFPFGKTVKRIKEVEPPLYRLRVNAKQSYRIFYRITDKTVNIEKVVPKKDAHKVLKRLFFVIL